MDSSLLPVLPIILPFLAAALLAGIERVATRRLIDAIATMTALAVTAVCALLVVQAYEAPFTYWFGGWKPVEGIPIGIAFVYDLTGTGMAAFVSLLVTASLIFSWRYFDAVGAHYHALVLVFQAAMVGFCLSGDLFTYFAFFELMGVAAYALTAYKIEEKAPLQGAINFAVTNTIAASLLLFGIAFLYARTGVLNLAEVGTRLAASPVDGLVVMAFALVIVGFCIKSDVVPFHFSFADAHTVPPAPVLVLFSGVMVQLGVYAVARIFWVVFSGAFSGSEAGLTALLVGAGALTAVVGGLMCFAQDHLMRLLAFSTISHVGVFLIGIAFFTSDGLAGTLVYILEHGFVKAALFMCAGILLHRYESVKELKLYGRARDLRFTGALFFLAGLGLAGLPPFGTYLGKGLIEHAALGHGYEWVLGVIIFSSVMTGGAVLRAGGRIFLGWGTRRDEFTEEEYQEDAEEETEDPPLGTPRVMLLPVVVFVGLALATGIWYEWIHYVMVAAEQFQNRAFYHSVVLEGVAPALEPATYYHGPSLGTLLISLATTLGAIMLALITLFRDHLPKTLHKALAVAFTRPVVGLKALHSGHVGDYVAWLLLGVVAFGGLCAIFVS